MNWLPPLLQPHTEENNDVWICASRREIGKAMNLTKSDRSLEKNKATRACIHTLRGATVKGKKRKGLILPPNACFITKFMMMAFNSLPSLSEQCYIQQWQKSRSPFAARSGKENVRKLCHSFRKTIILKMNNPKIYQWDNTRWPIMT